jgi:hypothetical protein
MSRHLTTYTITRAKLDLPRRNVLLWFYMSFSRIRHPKTPYTPYRTAPLCGSPLPRYTLLPYPFRFKTGTGGTPGFTLFPKKPPGKPGVWVFRSDGLGSGFRLREVGKFLKNGKPGGFFRVPRGNPEKTRKPLPGFGFKGKVTFPETVTLNRGTPPFFSPLFSPVSPFFRG